MSDGGSSGHGWGDPPEQGAPAPWAQPGEQAPWGSAGQQGGTQGPWASPQPSGPPGYAPPAYPPPGGAPYGAPFGGPAYGAGWTPTQAAPTSGLAIASLVVSLAGVVTIGFTGIIGLILGLVARSQIKAANGQKGGGGLALAGIIVGIVMFLGFIGFIVLIATVGNSNTTYSYNYNSLAHLGSVLRAN